MLRDAVAYCCFVVLWLCGGLRCCALDGSDGTWRSRSSSPRESRTSEAGGVVAFEDSSEAIDAAEWRKVVSLGGIAIACKTFMAEQHHILCWHCASG